MNARTDRSLWTMHPALAGLTPAQSTLLCVSAPSDTKRPRADQNDGYLRTEPGRGSLRNVIGSAVGVPLD